MTEQTAERTDRLSKKRRARLLRHVQPDDIPVFEAAAERDHIFDLDEWIRWKLLDACQNMGLTRESVGGAA